MGPGRELAGWAARVGWRGGMALGRAAREKVGAGTSDREAVFCGSRHRAAGHAAVSCGPLRLPVDSYAFALPRSPVTHITCSQCTAILPPGARRYRAHVGPHL